MASTRQIENLERKHRENPEGLTFAPLANAYRNSGQPERAIEILTLGLEHHPEHAPARIVLGRCHVDLGDDTAAEAAFTKVLELDQENVVALKALADITERGGRFGDSIRWLNYLLEVDRNNDDARDQLARVSAAAESEAEQPAAEGTVDAEPASAGSEPTAEVASGTIGGISPFEPPTAPSDEADTDAPGSEEAAPEPASSPWAHPLAGSPPETSLPEDAEDDESSPWASPADAEPPSIMPGEVVPTAWEPPTIVPEAVAGIDAAEFGGPGGPEADGPVEGLEPAEFEASAESSGGASALEGLESAVFESPEDADSMEELPGLQSPGDEVFDAGLTIEKGEEIVLRAAEENEFQAANAAEELNLEAANETEYQTPSTADDMVLRPSGPSEYQSPQDSQLLGSFSADAEADEPDLVEDTEPEDEARVETEIEAESSSVSSSFQHDSGWSTGSSEGVAAEIAAEPEVPDEPEVVDEAEVPPVAEEPAEAEPVSSWFAPADEDAPATLSQPDGTAESLEAEGPPAVPPFEEAEQLPSAWSPAEAGATVGDAIAPSESPEDEAAGDVADDEATPIDAVDAGLEGADGLEAAPAEDSEPYEGAEPEIVATETMAELYLSQGHRHEALEVYRILREDAPDDQRLVEKVEALEAELEGAQAQEDSEAVAESAWDEVTVEETPDSERDYAASKTGGQPARAFFKNLLAARPSSAAPPVEASPEEAPPDSTGGDVVGQPTRPADDRLSLSAVFGEDTSPVPPAVADKDESEGEGFSFDTFFDGERGDPGRRRPAGQRPRSEEDEADLDQFHAWLQGLKG